MDARIPLLITIILFLAGLTHACAGSVHACTDVEVTPKQFYSTVGRTACYDAYENYCTCRYVDGSRVILIKKNEIPKDCTPSFVTLLNPTPQWDYYIEQQICIKEHLKTSPTETTPMDVIPVTP